MIMFSIFVVLIAPFLPAFLPTTGGNSMACLCSRARFIDLIHRIVLRATASMHFDICLLLASELGGHGWLPCSALWWEM